MRERVRARVRVRVSLADSVRVQCSVRVCVLCVRAGTSSDDSLVPPRYAHFLSLEQSLPWAQLLKHAQTILRVGRYVICCVLFAVCCALCCALATWHTREPSSASPGSCCSSRG